MLAVGGQRASTVVVSVQWQHPSRAVCAVVSPPDHLAKPPTKCPLFKGRARLSGPCGFAYSWRPASLAMCSYRTVAPSEIARFVQQERWKLSGPCSLARSWRPASLAICSSRADYVQRVHACSQDRLPKKGEEPFDRFPEKNGKVEGFGGSSQTPSFLG